MGTIPYGLRFQGLGQGKKELERRGGLHRKTSGWGGPSRQVSDPFPERCWAQILSLPLAF